MSCIMFNLVFKRFIFLFMYSADHLRSCNVRLDCGEYKRHFPLMPIAAHN